MLSNSSLNPTESKSEPSASWSSKTQTPPPPPEEKRPSHLPESSNTISEIEKSLGSGSPEGQFLNPLDHLRSFQLKQALKIQLLKKRKKNPKEHILKSIDRTNYLGVKMRLLQNFHTSNFGF